MKTNTAHRVPEIRTHEGAPARRISAEERLVRSVNACLLWEDSFYESGASIADRIREGVHAVHPKFASELAISAREEMNLRHAPLLIARELVRHPHVSRSNYAARTIERVIQRADELAEIVSIYWAEGRQPLAAQMKKGLAAAFTKFDAYQLAKYNRDAAVKLRDVLFLCHAKPRDKEQEAIWKQLVDGTLEPPGTWENRLSAGEDKRETFEDLLRRGKLGYLALLRNLRNMVEAGVDRELVISAIRARKGAGRILPYRYIAAARSAPTFEPALDAAMQATLAEAPRLPGRTLVLVDVSASMDWKISTKSTANRIEAATGLAVILAGVAEECRIFTFSNHVVEVPARANLSLPEVISRSQGHGGTRLGAAVSQMNATPHDRLVVITDEQSQDPVPGPKGRGYMLNVAAYENGVGYGEWTHITGWSDSVVRYILATE